MLPSLSNFHTNSSKSSGISRMSFNFITLETVVDEIYSVADLLTPDIIEMNRFLAT